MKHLPAILFGLCVAGLLAWMSFDGFAQARPHHSRISSRDYVGVTADGGDAATAADGGDASADGGDVGADGGDAQADGGDVGADGGDAQADGGDVGADGGDAQADGGDASADGGDASADGGDAALSNTLALRFDGVDERVDITDTAALEPGAAWSFCAWLKEDTLAVQSEILRKDETNQRTLFFQKKTNSALRFTFFFSDALTTLANSCSSSADDPTIASGVYYHLCAVYNGAGVGNSGRFQYYINANARTCAFTGTIPASTTDSTSNFKIAGRSAEWGPGTIDEPMMFNTALTSGQVSELYHGGVPTYPQNTSAASACIWWSRFGDAASFPTVVDQISGRNGTMVNMEAGDIVSEVP